MVFFFALSIDIYIVYILIFDHLQGKSNEWILEFTGSPGNLVQFESMLFENSNEMVISTCVIALNLKVISQQRVSLEKKIQWILCGFYLYTNFIIVSMYSTLESLVSMLMNDEYRLLNLMMMISFRNLKQCLFCQDQKSVYYHQRMVM